MNSILGTKFKVVSGYKGQAQMMLAMQRRRFTAAATGLLGYRERASGLARRKKVHLLLQLGLTKGTSPALHDVPLVMDVARNTSSARCSRFSWA